ncbi:MAG TPA: TrmH family RNA methyltransferase, partial [Acidimicrobiales bacterium]|nr:TrmH family RNA methyltransferase [Acidimicrobiales bacterium]
PPTTASTQPDVPRVSGVSGPVEVRHIRTQNDEFQVLRSLLTNRQKRHQRGEFVVQGVKPIDAALRTGWPLHALIVNDDLRRSQWATGIIDTATVARHIVVPGPLMALLAQKEEPVELLAIAAIRRLTLADVAVHAAMTLCVCDRLQSPGNLGSIVRSADALGADAVVLLGRSADPYDPQAVRGSTGSVFSVPVVTVPSHETVAAWLVPARSEVGLRVLGTDEHGTPLTHGVVKPPVAILLGSEATGLSRAARELCDDVVALPMRGVASSLNVAAAASIFLYAATQSQQ